MSDTEKAPVADNISNSEVDQIVDPDAGLSDAERAENVSILLLARWASSRRRESITDGLLHRNGVCYGSWT